MGQPNQGHFQVDPGIGRLPHGHLGQPKHFHAPHHGGQPQPLAQAGDLLPLGVAHRHQLGGDHGQEGLAQVLDEVAGQLLGAPAGRGQVGHGHQGPSGVPLSQCFGDLAELGEVVVHGVGRGHLVEHGECVPGRSPAAADGDVESLVGHVQVCVVSHLGEEVTEGVGIEQPELEVLGAAADGGQHLLRVGGGQDEDHVSRRLLQRLQQRVGGRRGEHVDLVDDVDLLPPGSPERGPGHQVTHGLHPVVGCGVELVDVEGRALGDLDARGAHPARLAVFEVGAVQRLGQDAGRRGLARAAWPAEQVGMGHPVIADGVAEGQHHMVLAPDLLEPAGTVAPVERLVRGVVLGRAARSRVWGGLGRYVGHCLVSLQAADQRPAPTFGAVARLAAAHRLTC
jgi:hypothetical protein